LPLTGAASSSMPRAPSSSRSSAEPSSEIDEHSTTSFVRTSGADSSACTTSFTSFHADTITNTMSQAARSVTGPATLAPCASSGCAFARVRFQTTRPAPALARRSAMA
jgi:hypothetical protein